MTTRLRLVLLTIVILWVGQAEAQATPQASLPTIICPLSICGVIAVGVEIKTQAKLNVRTAPGVTSPYVDPINQSQIAGAVGIVVDGPVVLNSQTWWKIDWAFGPPKTGWSAETASGCPAGVCLIASPLVPLKPTVGLTITLPPCAKDTPPCVVVEWTIVPIPETLNSGGQANPDAHK